MDLEGVIYDHALTKDIFIKEPDNFNDIKDDKKVLAGINWIKAEKQTSLTCEMNKVFSLFFLS
jgi:hypothetical protein